MAKRNKKYIPNKKNNPIVQAKRIDELDKAVQKHSEVLKTVISTYDKHVEHLANFANHDMKNSLQSMDSILFTNEYDNLTEESWEALKTCLKNIRTSFDNFSNLVPYSNSKKFQIDRLFIALNLLIKQDISDNKITFKNKHPKEGEINLPFQSVLQMLHNIIINAINSFKENTVENPVIELECTILNNNCRIVIANNGKKIEPKLKDKIFEYGYSSTNGSGIGLFHAKYVCNKLNGSIHLDLTEKNSINKSFIINLPLKSI